MNDYQANLIDMGGNVQAVIYIEAGSEYEARLRLEWLGIHRWSDLREVV